jgi:hypothetical protein
MNQRTRLGNAWDGENGLNSKRKERAKELERDFGGYGCGCGGGGGDLEGKVGHSSLGTGFQPTSAHIFPIIFFARPLTINQDDQDGPMQPFTSAQTVIKRMKI